MIGTTALDISLSASFLTHYRRDNVALLAFIFVVSNSLFLTLSHTLVIFFITISVMFVINCATWLGKLIVYLHPFQELVRIYRINYFSLTAYLYMDLVYGHSHPLQYKILKLPLLRFFAESGVSPFVVILVLFI